MWLNLIFIVDDWCVEYLEKLIGMFVGMIVCIGEGFCCGCGGCFECFVFLFDCWVVWIF